MENDPFQIFSEIYRLTLLILRDRWPAEKDKQIALLDKMQSLYAKGVVILKQQEIFPRLVGMGEEVMTAMEIFKKVINTAGAQGQNSQPMHNVCTILQLQQCQIQRAQAQIRV